MKLIKAVLFVLFCTGIAYSQQLENTLLWKVSGNGLKTPSYLFGTIHAACSTEVKISEPLGKVMKEVKQLYLEIDMDDPDLQKNVAEGLMMRNGVTIQQLLSEKEFEEAAASFAKATGGLSLSQFGTVKPLLLSSMLIPSLLDCETVSWEDLLMEKFKKQSKKIYGLESPLFQMSVFDSIPYDIQARELMRTVRDNTSDGKEMKELVILYAKQDIEGLHKLISSFSSPINNFESLLLNNRNKNWTPIIAKVVREQPTLFAFGAGHLAGANGVIKLLREQGYVVSPVINK